LIEAVEKKEVREEIVSFNNEKVTAINSFEGEEKELTKMLRKANTKILRLLEKELKLVAKNHYRNTWLAIGMTVFGIPIGVAFSSSGDSSPIAIGIPIGMAVGIAIGTSLDKKAEKAGKQLDL